MTFAELNALNAAYIAAKAKQDAIEAELKSLKAQIEATGLDCIPGAFADLKIQLQERVTLDKAVVEKYLTPAQLLEATKVACFPVIRIGKVKVSTAA